MKTCRDTDSIEFPRGERSGRAHSQSGFSLVELMVVIFLIGLAATFIVLSAPPSKPRLASDAEGISQLLSRAADEAMVSGLAYGALVEADSVQVVRFNSGTWVPVSDARISFSQDVTLVRLVVEASTTQGVPSIWFDPLGISNQARIDLTDGRATASILVAPDADVSIEQETLRAQ